VHPSFTSLSKPPLFAATPDEVFRELFSIFLAVHGTMTILIMVDESFIIDFQITFYPSDVA